MISPSSASQFAEDWIAAWNTHDLDRVLSHYRQDVIFLSPYAASLANAPAGIVRGRPGLRSYFQRALETYPDLQFEPIGAFGGVNSVAIHYRSVAGQNAVEVVELDALRRVRRSAAHYAPAEAASAGAS